MSWNYSGDPSDSPLDAVRFYLQDTDSTDPQMQDEEIEYFRTQVLEPIYGKVSDAPVLAILVAAYLADVLTATYREPSISADGVSIDYSALAQRYTALAAQLRVTYQNLAGVGGVPIVGGINFWDDWDPTVKPYVFGLRLHDNYRAGQQSYSGAGEIPSSENYEEGGMWTG
jgi:hypothetical protein